MEQERIRWRNLPHWDMPGAAYFVTTCLDGSIPAQGLLEVESYRKELSSRPSSPGETNAEIKLNHWKKIFARRDHWLDDKPAVRHLEQPALARIVVDAFYHFADKQYDLLGFVVMPSHVHWVFQPRSDWIETLSGPVSPRERICRSRNQRTALECNRLLQRTGQFWQHESYDHWIRDADEMERIFLYIENNPVKAKLAQSPDEWPFSSAHDRKRKGLQLGDRLTR